MRTYIKELEGHVEVVVLKHGLVVVEQGKPVVGVDEELVVLARMVHVVNSSCHQCCHDFQVGEDILQKINLKKCLFMCMCTCKHSSTHTNTHTCTCW